MLQERARALPSVAEAEEELAAATAELDRVTELSRTLTLTREFLTRAQDTVHRDIAPVIATTLRGWLPVVTEGRYVDATVDPATLRVQVCGPERRWRSADQLSVGTAEQVYLLLRVALAEHLTTEGETSPLLLDDVTVQADDGRTRQLLDLLLRLSEERQIVLFAQEPVVLDWAKERLSDERRHSVVELPRLALCESGDRLVERRASEVEMTDALIAELRELSPTQFANVVQTALAGRVCPGRASEIGALIVAVLTEDVTVELHVGSPVNVRTHLDEELRRTATRSAAHRAVLAENLLDSRAVAEALGRTGQNSRDAASTLRRAGRLVGIPHQHQYLYPAFQFDLAAGRRRAVVSRVNQELGAADDPWGVASWWVGK